MSQDVRPFCGGLVIYIGSAGWNIPRAHRHRFPAEGTQLARYASRLNAAEINTSFYRPHARTMYERWAAAVPASFRFAVKVPKVITHERALTRARDPLARFLDEASALGPRLGPLLVQLPPSLAFESRRVGRFFDLLRTRHPGAVVCEPRHPTWAAIVADRMLERFQIARLPRIRRDVRDWGNRAVGKGSSTTGGTGRPAHTFPPTARRIWIASR